MEFWACLEEEAQRPAPTAPKVFATRPYVSPQLVESKGGFRGAPCKFGWNCNRRDSCSFYHGQRCSEYEKKCICKDKDCPYTHTLRAKTKRSTEEFKCKTCKTSTHSFAFCPENICTICKEPGHISSVCQLNEQRVNKRKHDYFEEDEYSTQRRNYVAQRREKERERIMADDYSY